MELKKQLASAPLLVHFSNTLPLRLACDASIYGMGAVISHVMSDGSEQPIAYASRTLTKAEHNYSQIEKEALGTVFGVKKFHQYLYGRLFTLITDHKPLTSIFGLKSGIPTLAAARMQWWALLLAAYRYEIEFRPTLQHGNADCLSRLPLSIVSEPSQHDHEVHMLNMLQIQILPVNAEQIANATRKDLILSRVIEFTHTQWPAQVFDELKPYFVRRNE